MKIILQSNGKIEFNSLDDLARAIPNDCSGQPLNYGQGEGQVKIDNTVWGFYVNSKEHYYMQYEEGCEDWLSIQNLIHKIHKKLSYEFKVEIELVAEGVFEGVDNI